MQRRAEKLCRAAEPHPQGATWEGEPGVCAGHEDEARRQLRDEGEQPGLTSSPIGARMKP